MRYPILNLWTWDGAKEHLRRAGGNSVPFKAQVTAYTDILGYGMYMEIKANKNLDDYLGLIVHNTPDHIGTTPADLTGFFWALQLTKLSEEGDKAFRYALIDLTFGNSSNFALHEVATDSSNRSPAARALMNANPDSFGLFMDGQPPVANTNYFNNITDSKMNVFYTGEDNNGSTREDMIDFFRSSFERHSPKLQTEPNFASDRFNRFSWYQNPIPDFKKIQSYDYMLDEFEVEEIIDQNSVLPYTIIREWSYWRFTNPSNPNDVREDKSKVSMQTSYIDVNGNYQSLYIREAAQQEVYGYVAFAADEAGVGVVAKGTMPKMGATKFIQLPAGASTFNNYQNTLNKWATFAKQKSYKVYRALDVNQHVFYNGQAYIVSEVDYINEISVIGGTVGII